MSKSNGQSNGHKNGDGKGKIPPKKGRPSKFNSIDKELVKRLYLVGHTDFEVAHIINIAESTLHLWKLEHPEFSEAIKDWKIEADKRVEASLYHRAIGYSHETEEIFCAFGEVTRVKTIKHYAPSEVAAIFWLKNRQPDKWRDKPPETEDDRFTDQELIFQGVPNQKDPKAQQRFNKFYDQN